MSTHSTVKSDALNDAKSIIAGVQEYLPSLLKIQEGQDVAVTHHPEAKTVKMHGNERTPVNGGVFRFSDTAYEIGIQEKEDGSVELHYDSYVSGGRLRKRINGESKAQEPANIKTCQSYWRANMHARRSGKRMRTSVVNNKLLAFVPA